MHKKVTKQLVDLNPVTGLRRLPRDERMSMALCVTRILQTWKLTKSNQLRMLGLDSRDHRALNRIANGLPLPEKRDLIDRVGLILSIHDSLLALGPENPKTQARWLSRPDRSFNGYSPFEIIDRFGMLGLAQVRNSITTLFRE